MPPEKEDKAKKAADYQKETKEKVDAAGKKARQGYLKENPPKSRTKSWKALLFGPMAIVSWLFGKLETPPEPFRSESLKEKIRHADAKAAEAKLKAAKARDNVDPQYLAKLASEEAYAKEYAEKSKQRHNATIGAGIGAAIVIAMAFTPMGVLGMAASIIMLTIACLFPAIGFGYDRHKDQQVRASAAQAGKAAESAQLETSKSKTPDKEVKKEAKEGLQERQQTALGTVKLASNKSPETKTGINLQPGNGVAIPPSPQKAPTQPGKVRS